MAPPSLPLHSTEGVSYEMSGAAVPTAGSAATLVISMCSISLLSIFIFQRMDAVRIWSDLPACAWLTFAIYFDSLIFVVCATILEKIVGLNSSHSACNAAIWLCLISYITTKLIYAFLVEKAHIIRNCGKSRLQSKLYCFNSFGMLGIYFIIGILNMVYHIAVINEEGVCIIGMKRPVMIPLLTFDTVINIYLTALFLLPLTNLCSFGYPPRSEASARLRSVASRTFVGSCCTLISSIVNITALMLLEGEPGWVCFMCCNLDILFSAIVIQWVTSKDLVGSGNYKKNCPRGTRSGAGHIKHDAEKYQAKHTPKSSLTPSSTGGASIVKPTPQTLGYNYHTNGAHGRVGVVVTTIISCQSECNSAESRGALQYENEAKHGYFPHQR